MDIILGVVLIYLAGVAFLYFAQRSFIYFPDSRPPSPAVYNAADMNIMHAITEDGLELSGWYKQPADDKPVIVVFHGNASHMGMSAWKVRGFMDQGYGALLPAYRGYAGNPGKPTEHGLYKDARAFLDWLIKEQKMPADRIVLLGESLGSGVAVEMAANGYPSVRAVILESPYTSFPDLARRHYFLVPFVGSLVRDRYDSINKITRIKAPLLVVHGRRDRIVPFKLGQRLYLAATQPKEMADLHLADHNDLYMHGAEQRILHFLSNL